MRPGALVTLYVAQNGDIHVGSIDTDVRDRLAGIIERATQAERRALKNALCLVDADVIAELTTGHGFGDDDDGEREPWE